MCGREDRTGLDRRALWSRDLPSCPSFPSRLSPSGDPYPPSARCLPVPTSAHKRVSLLVGTSARCVSTSTLSLSDLGHQPLSLSPSQQSGRPASSRVDTTDKVQGHAFYCGSIPVKLNANISLQLTKLDVAKDTPESICPRIYVYLTGNKASSFNGLQEL